MAKWAHADVLDQGPNLIKTAAVRMLLLSGYAAGDSYGTVQAAKLAEVVMTSSDFTLANSGSNRTCTVAGGKSAVASAAASGTPDLHIAFTDGTSRVLWVTDETSNQAVPLGATVNFPSPVYTAQQPT